MKHVYMMFSALIAVVVILLQVLSVQHILSDMRLLQHNTQSICTSLPLLKHAVQRLNIDVVLLQEVWHPPDDFINIFQFNKPITKLRNGRQGGGVAIITHKNVKTVHMKHYDVDGLEAVWADVLCGRIRVLIGSVYIPPKLWIF